jgi:hypothetical protein
LRKIEDRVVPYTVITLTETKSVQILYRIADPDFEAKPKRKRLVLFGSIYVDAQNELVVL